MYHVTYIPVQCTCIDGRKKTYCVREGLGAGELALRASSEGGYPTEANYVR